MNRPLTVLTALLALSSFAQEGSETAGPKPKLAIVPFAALTSDVPPRAGTKALGMLNTELKSADAFTLVESKKEQTSPSTDEALSSARKALNEAQALRTKKKFSLAETAVSQGISAYKTAAAFIVDIGEVVDAYALLSAIQYNTGRDEEGAKSLVQALTLAPERDLPLAHTSTLFSRVVADTRKAVKESAPGTVLIESTPSNAPVMLDGLVLGSTPVLIKEVPPGLHFWKATLPSGEALGGTVEVVAQKQATAKAASTSKDPESRLLSTLAQNKLDADVVAAAGEHAKTTNADFVIFGALASSGKGLYLDTFLYATSSREVRRMARTSFDSELLSAGMEFFNLAGEVAKNGNKVGEAVKVPSAVSTSLPGGSASRNEVKYGTLAGKTLGADGLDSNTEQKDEGPRKPLEQKRRGPLKRQ